MSIIYQPYYFISVYVVRLIPLYTGKCYDNVHNPSTITINEETFLQDFL